MLSIILRQRFSFSIATGLFTSFKNSRFLCNKVLVFIFDNKASNATFSFLAKVSKLGSIRPIIIARPRAIPTADKPFVIASFRCIEVAGVEREVELVVIVGDCSSEVAIGRLSIYSYLGRLVSRRES